MATTTPTTGNDDEAVCYHERMAAESSPAQPPLPNRQQRLNAIAEDHPFPTMRSAVGGQYGACAATGSLVTRILQERSPGGVRFRWLERALGFRTLDRWILRRFHDGTRPGGKDTRCPVYVPLPNSSPSPMGPHRDAARLLCGTHRRTTKGSK